MPAPARVLMVQGTTSDAGKSTLVAALCRVFARAGYRVAPFKAQNMSNNAAVVDGGEIGRAQAVQALAAGVEPTVDMNPVLLKPQGDRTSQLVVLGRALGANDARGYYARKAELWPVVTGALDRLRAAHDVVVIEGAGSPAEINLAQYDIVNMRLARHAGAPVLLVGDIERGGVFAALYGTVMLLAEEERALVRGFVINKFRGDPSLLTPGFAMLEARTGVPTLGVLPYLDLGAVPAEDGLAVGADGRLAGVPNGDGGGAVVDVAVLRLPRIANLDEFQPLAREPGVRVRFVRDAERLGEPDLVVVPGTKATRADLAWARARGLDAAVRRLRERGTPVLGVCGGYQMLGLRVEDPLGIEGPPGGEDGFGLLPVVTEFGEEKVTVRVRARAAGATALWGGGALGAPPGAPGLGSCVTYDLDAYEIHMGRTRPAGGALGAALGPAPFATGGTDGAGGHADGASSADGRVVGTYLHGLFENAAFRRAVAGALAARRGVALPDAAPASAHAEEVGRAFDALADAVRAQLDLGAVAAMWGLPPLRLEAGAHA